MKQEENHIWEGLKEYKIDSTESFLDETEGGIEGQIKILQKLKPNEYFVVDTLSAEQTNTKFFYRYIERLKREGLDIGKGDAQYGFKMPLPKKKDAFRELIVFRRK